MVVEGVPQGISREQYKALISAAGFDVTELKSLEFRIDGIYAEVFGKDAEGHHLVDRLTEDVVVNRVFVPVVG